VSAVNLKDGSNLVTPTAFCRRSDIDEELTLSMYCSAKNVTFVADTGKIEPDTVKPREAIAHCSRNESIDPVALNSDSLKAESLNASFSIGLDCAKTLTEPVICPFEEELNVLRG